MPFLRPVVLFVASSLLLASFAQAGEPSVSAAGSGRSTFGGRVVDADGAPLAAASVAIYAGPADAVPVATASSDGQGRFTFHLQKGRYVLRVTRQQFQELYESVTVGEGEPAERISSCKSASGRWSPSGRRPATRCR